MTTVANKPFALYESILTLDKELGPLTRYGIGGVARYFLEPREVEQVAGVAREAADCGIPIRVLGGGANLLVAAERLECAVISLARIDFVRRNGRHLSVGAGARMEPLIVRCVDWGLAGLEGLSGIPGTAGGFVAMNAGGKWGEMADRVRSVLLVHPAGSIVERPASQLGFAYRGASLGDAIVAAVTFRLKPGNREKLRRRRQAILEEKLASQPLGDKSPGCVFRNPPGVSAGRLIEAAGLKSTSVGGATVSDRHANFILNTGGARAEEILALIDLVQGEVKKTSGVDLELELKIWS